MTRESSGSAFWLAVGTLWWRELVRFYRYRSRVLGALGTPLVFWLLIGSGIGRSLDTPGGAGYLEFFFPGTLLLIVLFTSIFCMMSIIEDRREGFLRSVLVAPVSRATLVLGKVLGGATLAVAQGLMFTALAPMVGIPLSLGRLAAMAGALFLTAFALAGLGFLLAWRIDSVQGFHGVANLFLIPLWLLSGALFPERGATDWVRAFMALNPLTYSVSLLRQALYFSPGGTEGSGPSLELSLGVSLAFAIVAGLAAFAAARRPTASDGD
ncbi:MAG: ABC transporter permease [Candidatus Acidiferrales bacterium]